MTALSMVESRSPQRPSDVVASEPVADRATVDRAAATARQVAQQWAGAPALARSQALNAAAGELASASERVADLIMREVGKPIGEAAGEVARGVAILRYYAQQALDANGETYPASDGRSLLMTRRFPLGVAGLITPWNFPVAIPLWKAAPRRDRTGAGRRWDHRRGGRGPRSGRLVPYADRGHGPDTRHDAGAYGGLRSDRRRAARSRC